MLTKLTFKIKAVLFSSLISCCFQLAASAFEDANGPKQMQPSPQIYECFQQLSDEDRSTFRDCALRKKVAGSNERCLERLSQEGQTAVKDCVKAERGNIRDAFIRCSGLLDERTKGELRQCMITARGQGSDGRSCVQILPTQSQQDLAQCMRSQN